MTLALSLDGGGIRGALSAELLLRLEERRPFLGEVALVAGTSTGGLLALGLASGKTPEEMLAIYRDHGERIFRARDLVDRLVGPLDEMVRAHYSAEGLREVVSGVLGTEATLGELQKRVLITTFDLGHGGRPWKPKFLQSFPGQGSDGDVLAIDAALRTTAAPTYFPSYQGFIDGGVVANNPCMCALAQMIHEGYEIGEIRLLSVGTGFNPHSVKGGDWGFAEWAGKLIPMWFDGMAEVANYQCRQMLGSRFFRLDEALPDVIDLDAVDQVKRLVEIADGVDLEPAAAWLDACSGA